MTESNWKPGDVAKLGSFRVFYSEDFDPEKPHRWQFTDGSSSEVSNKNMERARPLVVIDPEDDRQVERFAKAILGSSHQLAFDNLASDWGRESFTNGVQEALRELASPTPPKPVEPTGLGAVVVDDEGCTWVRIRVTDDLRPWRTPEGQVRRWHEVDAVQVLAEGVPA